MVRHVCGADSNVGIFCSRNDAGTVIEEGLKGVKTAFVQRAPIVSAPSTTTSHTTFDTTMLSDAAALRSPSSSRDGSAFEPSVSLHYLHSQSTTRSRRSRGVNRLGQFFLPAPIYFLMAKQ